MTDRKPSLWAILYQYKVHHILLWVAYYIFWVLMYIKFYPSIWALILVVSVYFIFQASAFYITAYFLFPRFLYKQKFGSFFLQFGVLTAILAFAQGYILYLMYKDASGVPTEYSNLSNMVQFSFMSIITMVGLLAGAKLVVEKVRSDRVNRIRDQQRLESELQYLKAQVNPHFLFNAINSVYFLIKKDQNLAAETLIKLSDLLRYQLYDCSDEKIAIEKEIEYLNNFITLEKIRKGEKVAVTFNQVGNLTGFQISPFLLIPFIENAFKHVSNLAHGENVIDIRMQREGGEFIMQVENTAEKVLKHQVGGIGLKNVKRRLELLYPGTHRLTIQEDDKKYSVTLSLQV
jgi:two-component system, LytTR family, sensor kinase